MAKVVVFYRFAEGAVLQTIVEGKTSYPDALAQMRGEAIKAFSEAMAAATAPVVAVARLSSLREPMLAG